MEVWQNRIKKVDNADLLVLFSLPYTFIFCHKFSRITQFFDEYDLTLSLKSDQSDSFECPPTAKFVKFQLVEIILSSRFLGTFEQFVKFVAIFKKCLVEKFYLQFRVVTNLRNSNKIDSEFSVVYFVLSFCFENMSLSG